jgi:AcrR family transcriptional regulator
MGRKSLEKERTRQLMESFIKCIAENGLTNTSLEDVAVKAGMTRSIIRHYIGNRDAFVDELIDYIIENSLTDFNRILSDPTKPLKARLIEALFAPRDDWHVDTIIIHELVNAKERFHALQGKIAHLIGTIIERIRIELHKEYPHRLPEEIDRAAYALFCISFANDSLIWLGLPPALSGQGTAIAGTLMGNWLEDNQDA